MDQVSSTRARVATSDSLANNCTCARPKGNTTSDAKRALQCRPLGHDTIYGTHERVTGGDLLQLGALFAATHRSDGHRALAAARPTTTGYRARLEVDPLTDFTVDWARGVGTGDLL